MDELQLLSRLSDVTGCSLRSHIDGAPASEGQSPAIRGDDLLFHGLPSNAVQEAGIKSLPRFPVGSGAFHNAIKGPLIAPLILLQRPGIRQTLRFLYAQLIAGKDGSPVRLPDVPIPLKRKYSRRVVSNTSCRSASGISMSFWMVAGSLPVISMLATP